MANTITRAKNRSATRGAVDSKRRLISPKPAARVAFFGTEIGLALAIFATQAPQLEGPILLFGVLLALDVVAGMLSIQVYGDSYISVGIAITISLIVLFGVPGVVIAAPVAAVAGAISRKRFDFRAIHNAAMFVVVYSTAAATYATIGEVNPSGMTWNLVPAVLAATVVAFSFSAVLLGIVLSLMADQGLRAYWQKHAWLAPHYTALGFIGLALALAYVSLGFFGIIAFLTPVGMLRLALHQYVEKTKNHVAQLESQNEALTHANIEVRRMSDELRDSYDGTLEALVNALDARDQETKGHSIRVSKYMMDIARELGVVEGSEQWLDMQRGSLLHDVGKIGVSDTILLKPGKLTEEEWAFMRQHPEIGYNMLRQVKFLEGPAEIILAHHERWDGQGYPRGLRETEIPLGARIFPVVDTFDAMTSDRPYRKALSTQVAMNEILKYSGTQFDPLVVEAFLDIYQKWVQMWIELHNEESNVLLAA